MSAPFQHHQQQRSIRRYDPHRVLHIQAQHSPPKEGTYIGRRGSGSSSSCASSSRGGSAGGSRSSPLSTGFAADPPAPPACPSPDTSKPNTVNASCFAGDDGICAGGHHGSDVLGGGGPATLGGVMYPVSITLMVNNTQPIYMEMLPDDRELFLECPADPNIQHKRLMNGKIEIECVFFTPNECKKHRAGRLVVDNKHVLELGPLSRDLPVHCGMLVDEAPKTFRFEVCVVDSPAEHPAETHLVRHTLAILENDEFFGSVSSSHLQNQVRDLPFYGAVIGPIRKCWTDFIKVHTDVWDVFKYEQEDIDMLELQGSVRCKEFRLCARSLLEDYKEGDVARDQVRQTAERQLHDILLEKLRERPYEQSELLADLIKEKAFLAIITPNVSKLLDYFEAHPDRFFVLRSHLHPILVEARKEGIQDDPKFDFWEEQQRRAQMQFEDEQHQQPPSHLPPPPLPAGGSPPARGGANRAGRGSGSGLTADQHRTTTRGGHNSGPVLPEYAFETDYYEG